jgi:cytochrome c biogenesis protein CcmG/thiol:disulfide interchange protein DsbE
MRTNSTILGVKNNILPPLTCSIYSTIQGMKKISTAFALLLITTIALGQNDLPNTKIRSLVGTEVSFSSLGMNSDTAIIISLWATWCIPCIQELEAIAEQYDERQKETPFKLIAISIDDSRTTNRVKPFVKGRGWPFDIYLDVNSDLKRALNINDVPHVLIIKSGKIVYQHNGYVAGNEEVLFEKIKAN